MSANRNPHHEAIDAAAAYGGFWRRVIAAVIDMLITSAVAIPALWLVYGREHFDVSGGPPPLTASDIGKLLVAGPADFVISWLFPAAFTITFWHLRQATPGKMLVAVRIVDARSSGQRAVRRSRG